ncbi:MAG: efflux transporter outer membrane subunit [Myxococcaceae bacterium]|jgi:multidrug efflux system outer membrane protein|nr:efflux transporter outer membrane subunit [Myxococcaceae bacterium]
MNRELCTAALAVFASACLPSLADNPVREARTAVPASYGRPDVEAPATASLASQTWSSFFEDPKLRGLIDEALKNNQELNVRLQELIIATAEAGARRGEYLPRLEAGVDTGVEKVGAFTSRGSADRATGVPDPLGTFAFGLRGSWEVDVWGRLRAAAQAAGLRAEASAEARHFVVTQLVAEIARTYYELCALDAQLDVLERNVKLQSDALEVVKLEKQAARVSELAVQRFQAEVTKTRSRRFEFELQRVQAENRINFLLGRFPQRIERDVRRLAEPLPVTVEAGVPAQLLEHRPDVRRAQRDLEAAKLDVHAARAAFFPALSIRAAVGYESFNLAHLVATPESLLANLAGNLVAPLLNRAGIEAQYRAANARQLQAVFTYEQTVLQAFTDVVNQLAQLENLGKTSALQAQQVATLDQAVETSKVLFQSARADYMEVLLTRRDSLEAQLELIETQRRLRVAMVGLYQALGGGWRLGKS